MFYNLVLTKEQIEVAIKSLQSLSIGAIEDMPRAEYIEYEMLIIKLKGALNNE